MSKDKIKIFFKTSISSIISAGVDLSVFYFLSTVFEREYFYVVLATVIARLFSGTVNFLINKFYAFQSTGRVKVELVSYTILFIIKMILSSLIVAYLSTTFTETNETLIKIIVDVILFFASFYIQDKYIFNENRRKKSSS
jgi:putative flippase GtrA